MPITVLLGTMRHLWSEAYRDGKPDLDTMQAACAVAAQAAPFVHPRLASMNAKVEAIGGVSDGALELRVAAVLESLDQLTAPEEDEADPLPALPAPVDEAAE